MTPNDPPENSTGSESSIWDRFRLLELGGALQGWSGYLVALIALSWYLFQLSLASVLILDSLTIRASNIGLELLNVFVESADLERSTLAKGIGVSGSALSGKAVFTGEDIAMLQAREPETPLILIRQDTVPEDITIISLTDGLLTSRGGQTSHASVVAVRLEKTCVVGCKQLRVYERYAEVNGYRIEFGDEVSIDGRNGLLLKGSHPVKEEMHILPI